jgi:hypothetical protein
MALSLHQKRIVKLYFAAFILIFAGVGILTGGLIASYYMRERVRRLGRELAVLEIEDRDDWGDIPGTRNRDLRHQFHLFNVTNPRAILYGQKPVSRMFGPWTFEEERDSEDITVRQETDAFGFTGELFHYVDAVKFFLTGVPTNHTKELSETYNVYNYEAFAVQYSHRGEEEWMRATRALSGLINYTATHFRDQLILHKLKENQFEKVYGDKTNFTEKRLFMFQNLPSVSLATINNFWEDSTFGFKNSENIMFWGQICEERSDFGKSFVQDFFFVPYDRLEEFLGLF